MVKTLNIQAEITEKRELNVTLPGDIPLGPAEITLVESSSVTSTSSTLGGLLNSEFFGMWRERADISDSVEFARELRVHGWKRPA